MSIRIAVERRAAAFAKIAPYMGEEKRRTIAEEIAEEMRPFQSSGGSTPQPASEEEPAGSLPPMVDPPGTVSVVSFLIDKGFREVLLVKAAGMLTPILAREWVARYGDDAEYPVGFIPSGERPLLEHLYRRHHIADLLGSAA